MDGKNHGDYFNMDLYKLIRESASVAINLQREDGSMPPGQYGPHNHISTPVRNTCHWLITFSKMYNIYKDSKFLNAAQKIIGYLVKNRKQFPYNFQCRLMEDKDKCNGLIGPAWIMEALLITSNELKINNLQDLAAEIFQTHPFNEKSGLWYIREIDGTVLKIDPTFNHQLCFAAVGSMFDNDKYPVIKKQVNIFLKKLKYLFFTYSNGLIKHLIRPRILSLKDFRRVLGNIKMQLLKKEYMHELTIGYHCFNLVAFGMFKKKYPELSFWRNKNFLKAITLLEKESFKKILIENKFALGYNVAGFEIAYVYNVFFPNSEDLQKSWINEQIKRHYDLSKKMLNRKSTDPDTLFARLYEATRLPNFEIEFSFI